MITPIDALAEEVQTHPDMLVEVGLAVASKQLPESNYDHPVVVNAGADECVVPVSVYMDKVPFTRTESALGFWM
eukprot:1040675-Pyramimonas_sp.AAC.1